MLYTFTDVKFILHRTKSIILFDMRVGRTSRPWTGLARFVEGPGAHAPAMKLAPPVGLIQHSPGTDVPGWLLTPLRAEIGRALF